MTAMDVALLGVSATTAHIMRHSLRGVTRGVTDRALGQVPVVMRVGARQRGSVRDYATFLRCFARSLVTESVYLIGVELNPPAADRSASVTGSGVVLIASAIRRLILSSLS